MLGVEATAKRLKVEEVREGQRLAKRSVGGPVAQSAADEVQLSGKITDPKHPAFGEFGAFAATALKPGDLIVDYIGVVKERSEKVDASPYALSFAPGLIVDALHAGNEARFVNDARGTGKSQNACFKTYWCLDGCCAKNNNGKRATATVAAERRIAYFCCKSDIQPGEEVLTSYGKAYWVAEK